MSPTCLAGEHFAQPIPTVCWCRRSDCHWLPSLFGRCTSGPRTWNNLLNTVTSAQSLHSFRCHRNTFNDSFWTSLWHLSGPCNSFVYLGHYIKLDYIRLDWNYQQLFMSSQSKFRHFPWNQRPQFSVREGYLDAWHSFIGVFTIFVHHNDLPSLISTDGYTTVASFNKYTLSTLCYYDNINVSLSCARISIWKVVQFTDNIRQQQITENTLK